MRYLKNNKIFYYKYVNKKNCINKKDTFDSRESMLSLKLGHLKSLVVKSDVFIYLNNIVNIIKNNSNIMMYKEISLLVISITTFRSYMKKGKTSDIFQCICI